MIQIEGLSLERFLNRILRENLRIWNIRRLSRTCLTAEMGIRDFYRLRPIRRQFRCRIHILERHGMPFMLARFRHRKVLVVGCALCLIAVLLAQTRVWFIQVDGCYRVPENVVYRALEESGVQEGIARGDINLPKLNEAVRGYDERIAWAGAKLSGILLRVEIVEADLVPDLPDKSVPSNIVATKDGVIEQVIARSGKAAVKQGDVVRAGDILIRGDITKEEATERLLVFADGEVFAKVWYTADVVVENKTMQRVQSGSSTPYRALYLAGILVYQSDIPYADYTLELDSDATLSGAVLPLRQVRGQCLEMVEREVEIPQEELSAEVLFQAETKALDMVPQDARILAKTSETFGLEDGSMRAKVSIQTQEQIGRNQPISETDTREETA